MKNTIFVDEVEEFRDRLANLTNEEIKLLLIKSGIYDKDLNLTESYKLPKESANDIETV